MSRTDNIAEFISTIKYEDLPPQVVKAAKNMIMDTLGVIVGTSRIHPEDAQIIWKTVEAYGGKPAATAVSYTHLYCIRANLGNRHRKGCYYRAG